MAITLAEVQTKLAAAWAAIQYGGLEYTVHGNTVKFHSLAAFQKHIDWLRGLEAQLTDQASGEAGNAECPVVTHQEQQV